VSSSTICDFRSFELLIATMMVVAVVMLAMEEMNERVA
jgi:hypothetical protein